MKLSLPLIAFMLLVVAGCHLPAHQIKPLVEDRGECYLYLSAFPREGARLSFVLESLAVELQDGGEVPLPLRLADLNPREMAGQRLVASLPLPPGSYRGLVLRLKKASLRGEKGEAALLVPEGPVRVPFPFEVRKGKGVLISLRLDQERSLKEGVRFDPVFEVRVPPRPLLGVTGYVTNFSANTITVFDKKACEAVAVIQTGRGPAGIVLDQRLRRAYVALTGDDAVDVIDVSQGAVVDRIPLTPGDAPRDLALTPDGALLVSANSGSNSVSLLDPNSLTEVARIVLPVRADSVLMDRAGRRAYLFHTMNNSISVLDLSSRKIFTTFATDATPQRGDFTRSGDRLIVFYSHTPDLLVYDTASLSEVKRVYHDVGTSWIKVDTASDRIYVGRQGGSTLQIFDPFSFIPSDSLRLGSAVSYMTIDGEENNLYAILPDVRRLQIVNLVSKTTVGAIEVDDSPYWATVMGER